MLAILIAAMILGIFFMKMREDNYLQLRIQRNLPYCKQHGTSCLKKGCSGRW